MMLNELFFTRPRSAFYSNSCTVPLPPHLLPQRAPWRYPGSSRVIIFASSLAVSVMTLLPSSSASTVAQSWLANGLKAFNTKQGTKYMTLEELVDDHPGETRATVERLGQLAFGA